MTCSDDWRIGLIWAIFSRLSHRNGSAWRPAAATVRSRRPATKVLIRVGVYYIVVVALGILAWRYLPRTHLISDDSLNVLFGSTTETVRGTGKNMVVQATATGGPLAASVALAMLAAFAVALPVAWIYTSRARSADISSRSSNCSSSSGWSVAGIVVMVKYSIALAFSLGGIAAAVRFRNSLDDSKRCGSTSFS
jgi:hypothetical protein